MQQLIDLKRFADEIPRPALDRFHGILDGAVAGHHDGHNLGIPLDGRVDDRRSVDAGEPEVGDDDVEREIGQTSQGRLARVGLLDVVAAIGQLLGDSLPKRRLVLNQKQMFRRFSHLAGANTLT